MRSAEASDAVAEGFGAADESEKRKAQGQLKRSRRPLTPVTLAVAVTWVIAVVLFAMYDAYRSFDHAPPENSGIAELVAAAVPLDQVELELSQASLLVPSRGSALTGGAPSLNWEPDLALGVIQRAGLALALGALLTLAVWRLTSRPGRADPGQKQGYRVLASAVPMGLACWTGDGDLVACNDKYRESLELGQEPTTYHAAVRRLVAGGYMKLIKESDDNRLLELHREDGSVLLIDERPLGDGGFMTLVSDVTEAKKTDSLLNVIREEQRLLARRYHEEKLKAEAASRSKTNFLAHLSHDIRTPLNHIIGFADLIDHQTYGPVGDPRYAEYVRSIRASGERLLQSFGTILEMAELEGGQKGLRADAVAVDEIIGAVAQRYRATAHRSGVHLVIGTPTGAIMQGDQRALVRMMSNIVENSLRFTPQGGQITLAGFAARDGVVIEVTDTGIGMSEERLATLSQPFALGDATFTREGVGPGLGISIARAIAELSGGQMAIDSSPSLGTTVAFSLPLQADAAMVAAE
jgi:two-component system cell cycle sensor histidine kinase PleC